MYTEDACGILTGGVAVIGVMFLEDKPSENIKLTEITQLWVERFKEEFQTTNCALIKGVFDIGDVNSCRPLILKGCDILEEVIEKYIDK